MSTGARRTARLGRLSLPLAAALLLLGATNPARSPRSAASSRILFNARVFTGDTARPFASAVAIRGDVIIAVGNLAEVARAAGPGASRTDLEGRFLMPGMIDAHVHPIWGIKATRVFANYAEPEVSVPALRAFAEARLRDGSSRLGDVLAVYNVDVTYWEKAAELDRALSEGAFANAPLVLVGRDGHSAWANATLRRRLGITAASISALPEPDRINYGRSSAGEPNGVVVEKAKASLMVRIPAPTHAQMLAAGRGAVRMMNCLGITAWLDPAASDEASWFDAGAPVGPGYMPVYQEMARSGELTAHVAAYPVIHPHATERENSAQIATVERLRAKYQVLPDFRVPGLKVFADGVPEFPAQTAALTKPYRNTGRMAPVYFRASDFANLVQLADRHHLSVHVHAVGDMAARVALDGFEAARSADGPATPPHTITHLQFVHPDDVQRFAQLGVIAALQLFWATADPSTNEAVKPYVDPAIYRSMYPARDMLEAGTIIAGSSDWPVTTANPFEAIYQAETRKGPQGVLFPEQRVPRIAMLYAYTRDAARVLDLSDRIGAIAPGKLADLVLLDRDVLTGTAEEARDAKVVWTMFRGRTVCQADR